jgi:hypothetical protein
MVTLTLQLRNKKKKSGHVEVMEESMIAEMVHLVKKNAERVKKENMAACDEWHCSTAVICVLAMWVKVCIAAGSADALLAPDLFIVGIDILG